MFAWRGELTNENNRNRTFLKHFSRSWWIRPVRSEIPPGTAGNNHDVNRQVPQVLLGTRSLTSENPAHKLLTKYLLPVKVKAWTTKQISTLEEERGRNGEEEDYWKTLCVNEIKKTTNIIQSSMNTTLAPEAILDLNSSQCTWFYAPTSLYIIHGNCLDIIF